MANSYEVGFGDWDTVIELCEGDSGDYGTFDEAREAAVEHLEDLIASCQETLDEIQAAVDFEDYRRGPAPATGDTRPVAGPKGPADPGSDTSVPGPGAGGSFYKAVYEVVVLSDEEPGDDADLARIAHDIDQGPCVGEVRLARIDRVTAAEMAGLLVELGSDPGFFGEDGGDDPAGHRP